MTREVKVGRTPRPMPDPIPDTPENVARALMTSPPRIPKDWKYLNPDKDSTGEKQQGRDTKKQPNIE